MVNITRTQIASHIPVIMPKTRREESKTHHFHSAGPDHNVNLWIVEIQ